MTFLELMRLENTGGVIIDYGNDQIAALSRHSQYNGALKLAYLIAKNLTDMQIERLLGNVDADDFLELIHSKLAYIGDTQCLE